MAAPYLLTDLLTAHVQARARDELPPPSELAAQWASARPVRSKRPILDAFSMQEIAAPARETASPAPKAPVALSGGPAELAVAGSSARPARRAEPPRPQEAEAEAEVEAEAAARTQSSLETKPRAPRR